MSTAKSSVGNILLNIQTSRLPKAKNEREVPSTSHLRRIKRQTQQNVKGNWRSKYFAAKKSVQHQIIKSNAPKHSLSDVNTVIPLGNGLKKDMNNQSLIKLNNENGQNDKLYQLEKLDNVSNESSKSFFNSQKRYRDKEDMTSQNDENINRKKVALNCRIKDKFLQKKSDSQASKNQGFISCVFGPKEFQNESKNIISNSNDELKPQNAPAVASKIKSESNLSESNSFENLGLLPSICDHLRDKMSLKKPTSIQLKAVPKILIKNKSMDHDGDFLLQSKTGSGKTLAYLLPLLQNIITLCSAPMGHPVTRAIGGIALILAPTRELANQIYSVADLLLKAKYPNHWIVSGLCNGGDKRKNEKSRFRKGVNIIVGTPGRVLDHLENTKALQLSYLRWIIFDEADKISELGFEPTVKKILALVAEKEKFKQDNNNFIPPNIWPDKCTHILCSATMSKGMNSMAGCPLRNTMFIKDDYLSKGNKLNESAIIHHIPVELVQNFLLSPPKLRFISLIALLNQAIFQAKTLCPKIIIFVSCCDSVNFHYEAFHQMQQHIKLKDIICNLKCKFFKLHGDLLQKDRTAACHMFRNIKHQPAVLISTDVASRGLDLTGVTHIFQYDAPFDVKDYIHRIGRTARSGSGGIATLFFNGRRKRIYKYIKFTRTP